MVWLDQGPGPSCFIMKGIAEHNSRAKDGDPMIICFISRWGPGAVGEGLFPPTPPPQQQPD